MSAFEYGDEYTELLNEFRPVGDYHEQRQQFYMYDIIVRLVSDARKYRTRALIAERDCVAMQHDFDRLNKIVDTAVELLRDGDQCGCCD